MVGRSLESYCQSAQGLVDKPVTFFVYKIIKTTILFRNETSHTTRVLLRLIRPQFSYSVFSVEIEFAIESGLRAFFVDALHGFEGYKSSFLVRSAVCSGGGSHRQGLEQ